MTDFDAIAQGMTQAVPFAGYLGLEITSIGEGEAVARLPERAELLARSAEISYEKIAKGPIDARATLGVAKDEALAKLDADGKVVFPCEIELTDSEGTRVATASVQWHVRLNKPVAAEAVE